MSMQPNPANPIDARAISNMATGSANLLYKHFDPQRKRAAEILEGVEQLDLTDEEALRQAERLREYAVDMVYVLEARLR